MTENNESITLDEFAHRHKNELVLDGMALVRLTGFKRGRDDNYWEFFDTKRGAYESSCVMGFIPLKKYLPEREYYILERIFVLNSVGTVRINTMKCPECGEQGLNYNPLQRVMVCPYLNNCCYVAYNCKIELVRGEGRPNDYGDEDD